MLALLLPIILTNRIRLVGIWVMPLGCWGPMIGRLILTKMRIIMRGLQSVVMEIVSAKARHILPAKMFDIE